ncbi:hypothetical protein RFF20_01320 [Pasteurella multocida]|uniref:DUF7424 family protein n=1 Tax=Pasteurella multocida TaxID=747 RepID=UPI002B4A21C7|nr:hypothetical protein [Pasteurella multocida]MEB3503751.1 hypothetical protein [Pasteurella multocida]WRK09647.1 hypothetical protein RFF20_01320 [Pasteurella multocida]
MTNVFDNAVYKKCYQKNFNSFASFEIAIAVGKLDDSSKIKHNVNIYSYKNHCLNLQTSDKSAKNTRDFVDKEYIFDLVLNLTHKINNDTKQALDVTFLSAYVNVSLILHMHLKGHVKTDNCTITLWLTP